MTEYGRKMNKFKWLSLTFLATSVVLTSTHINAAGFQLNAQSATGLGRAFAGDAVIADNASVLARNAAAMVLFDKAALSLGVTAIETDISVSDSSYNSTINSDYDNAGDTSYAPNIHLIVPVNEKFAVGMDIYSNFGTKTEFDDSFSASEFGGLTDVKSLNFGFAASYRINSQWGIGGGLDLIYGSGELQRTYSSQSVLDADADGWGLGFNLGTVFELDENNRFGFSYHYSPELEAKGDIYYSGTTAEDDTLYIPLPDLAEFSGYHRLNDTSFAVHYSMEWIGWSAFNTLDSKAFGTIGTYHWKDAMHFSIGGTYYLNDTWTLRSGYMYDQSAQDEVTSVSVPDSDRQWFSAGFTYHFDEKSNVDFGATYLLGEDVSVDETSKLGTTLSATTHANAILVAVQYSHTF